MRPLEDFDRYLESIEEDEADVCSVKVVANPRTQPQKLQALE